METTLINVKQLANMYGISSKEAKTMLDLADGNLSEAANLLQKAGHEPSMKFNNDICQLFYDRHYDSIWTIIGCNTSDCILLPSEEGMIDLLRSNFKIPYDETILYVRDTSFGNNRNQGSVITDKAIYLLWNNDSPEEIDMISWGAMSKVQYQNRKLFFYSYYNNEPEECLQVHLGLFVKKMEDSRTFSGESEALTSQLCIVGNYLADLFTEMANKAGKSKDIVDVSTQINVLLDEEKYDEALLVCKESFRHFPEETLFNCLLLGKIYIAKQQWDMGIKTLKEVETIIGNSEESDTEFLTITRMMLSNAYSHIEDWQACRKNLLFVSQNGDKEMFEDEEGNLTNDVQIAVDKMQIAEKKFVEHFLEIPYQKRKLLYITDEYVDLYQEHMIVMTRESAMTILTFPIGHPTSNTLYIGHPLIPNKYIPFKDYELQFIEDQVREFCQLVQCLGAKMIDISNNNEAALSSSTQKQRDIQSGINIKVAGASVLYQQNQSNKLFEKIRQSICVHQEFLPHKKEIYPNDFVWWKQMPSWQRLTKQCENSMLTSHKENFQTTKVQVTNKDELKRVEAEIKALASKANGNIQTNFSEAYEEQTDENIVIQVIFASPQELQNQHINSSSSVNVNLVPLPNEEQAFVDEIRFCLDGDNNITDTDRKYLDRKRSKLGLSPERAEELINMCVPSLSSEEQEYLDTFHELVDDANDISPKMRKMLDREADSLGISEQRKMELEKM